MMREFWHLPHQKVLVANEPRPRRSTRHKLDLFIEISTLLPSRVSRPTCHNLHGIYTKGIDIDLSDGIDDVPRCVKTLEPVDAAL